MPTYTDESSSRDSDIRDHTPINQWPGIGSLRHHLETATKRRLYERCEPFQDSSLGILKNMLIGSLANMGRHT
jgi:hypothetical protein